jgi:cell division initiation protein
MGITPLDIIKKQFKYSRKGFDEVAVRNFLDSVRETLVEQLNENQRLREMIGRRDAEIAQLKGEESSIKDTLVLARRLTEDLERKARRQADLIIGESQLEAQKILMATADERRELQAEIVQLQSLRTRLVSELQAVLSAYGHMLTRFEQGHESS